MTWIIGASSIFDYGMLISDIQVTFQDGRTMDIVQKAYPLGNYVVGGFAGSVKIGFQLLQSLSDILKSPLGYEDLEHLYGWDPREIANKWSPIAREIFEAEMKAEKKLGSRFLIVAASPNEVVSGYPFGDSKIYMIRFSSPEFKPQFMVGKNIICSIGSGSGVTKYKEMLRRRMKLGIFDPMIKAEIRNPTGWARTLAFSIGQMIEKYPEAGISKHLHIITVRKGEILIRNNNYSVFPPAGGEVRIAMPEVAQGYPQFLSYLNVLGADASLASC